jgi:NAD(P)-dependent dehydrogenase (short-subunit alcohol dehydrogenase family)
VSVEGRRVALITGGASGIGRSTALGFARQGKSVMIADVAEDAGLEVVREVEAEGGEAGWVLADVTRPEEAEGMVRATMERFGRIDYAVNAAGVGGLRAKTADYEIDAWHRVIGVNLTGVWLSMRYELPAMLQGGGGSIVNLASVAGVVGFSGHAAYAASKHGVVGLTRSAALEYARSGIRVNAVCPAFTWTPMVERMLEANPDMLRKMERGIPQGRLGTPEEVAGSILYLCSEAAGFMTGQAMVLDGGLSAG